MDRKIRRQVVATLIKAGRRDLAEVVAAELPPWVDTSIDGLDALVKAIKNWEKDGHHAIGKLRSNLLKNAPQVKNLEYAFKSLETIGRTGRKRIDDLRKGLKELNVSI